MSLFSSKLTEYDIEVVKALQGVLAPPELVFKYLGKSTRNYLIPVENHLNWIYGFFRIDGKLVDAPIGFSRKYNFLSKEFLLLDKNGSVYKTEKQTENVIHLPLKLTEFVLTVGQTNDGKFTPNEGSPFQTFGIEGSEGLLPVVYATEDETGIKLNGLYKTKEGTISSYSSNDPSDKKLTQEFLRSLRGIKKTVQTPIETIVNEEDLNKLEPI